MNAVGRVHELAVNVVKGTLQAHPSSVVLDEGGVRDDRRFHVVNAEGEQEGARNSRLAAVRCTWDAATEHLTLTIPGGGEVAGRVSPAERQAGTLYWTTDHVVEGSVVPGPWNEALSDHLGKPVRLVEADFPLRARDVGPVTLMSIASVTRLEAEMNGATLGAGRFRMNMVLEGPAAHAEDEWYGRRLAVGDCILRVTGPVPRCVVTTREAGTGRRDHPTLKGILAYRDPLPGPDGEPVAAPFGVYAEVERPGTIATGDEVTLLD
jgi:uncharacterized protein YcbX